jgi:hypothetical protein
MHLHNLLLRAQQLVAELASPEPGFATLCQCVLHIIN